MGDAAMIRLQLILNVDRFADRDVWNIRSAVGDSRLLF